MSAPYFIRYTEEDIGLAEACAGLRLADAHRLHAQDTFGEDSNLSHFHGALGEIAVSRALRVEWTCHTRRWNKPDVGRYEVRAIGPRVKYPEVKTKDNDSDTTPIMSVMLVAGVATGNIEMGIVLGWEWPSIIRKRGTRKDPGYRDAPAYFMNINLLNVNIPELETTHE